MKVRVAPPDIDRETVRFRWDQSAANPVQRVDSFFIRYEGVDLATFSPRLLYEVFLALQLRVFAAYEEPVEILFPEPIPRSTVDYWRAHHGAERVTIGPMQETIAYDAFRANLASQRTTRPYAVFLGGGKDSTLTLELLTELYGPDQVLVIQFIGPLQPGREREERQAARQESLMLAPTRRRLGVTTQRIWTDYQAQFRPEGYHRRPHLELYTAGALPALLAHGVSLVSFSHVWTEYAIYRSPRGEPRYRYANSRPEVLADQSRHYQTALGVDLTVTNLALPMTGLTATRLLAERYPAALAGIVSCTRARVNERWCYQCRKCRNFALLGLAAGGVDPEFNYDRLFRDSPVVRGLAAQAETGVELTDHGNAPWTRSLSGPFNYPTVCQAIADASTDPIADRLSLEAQTNLFLLQALYGNRRFPAVTRMPLQAIDRLDNKVARDISRLVTRHIPASTAVPDGYHAGPTEVSFGLEVVMPTRTERVAHLRRDLAPRRDDDRTTAVT